MLAQVIAKVGLKAVGAAGSAIAKTGKAFGMAGKALSEAGQQTSTSNQPTQSSNNVIVGNFGMAGSAGKQKITGGGTLPAPKAVAKPQVSTKMPTEKLLDTAVKYLTSIDKTLKAQLEFERRSYQEQAQLDREAIIENKPSTTFNDIKDRLSGFKSDVKDNVSTAGTILKYAAIFGAAGALIASALDEKQLDALKENVEEFKKKFGWLGDLASMIPAGGIFGFLFGGKGLKGRLRGGIIGIIAEAVATIAFNKMTGQGGGDSSAVNIAAVGGIGYLGYRGIKSASRLSTSSNNFVGNKIYTARTSLDLAKGRGAYSSTRFGASFRPSDGSRRISTSANFLASPRWRNFLAWLSKNGRRQLVRKIETKIAIALASGALAATGVGAVVGVLGILLNVFGSIFLAYEIYQLWQEWTSQEGANKSGASDAEIAKAIKEPDATKVGGTAAAGTTGSMAGKSLGRVTPEMLSKTPQQLTDDELRTLVEAQGRIEDPRGITNNPGGIRYGTGPLKEHQVGSIGANADSSVRIAKYDTAENGIKAAMINWKTSRYAGKPIRDSLGMWSGGDGARYESWLTGKTAQYTGSGTPLTGSSDNSISGMVNTGAEKMGELFGMLGSSIIKPGIARDFTPSGSNTSDQISNASMKLQNDITFGIKKQESKDKITSPTIPAGTPRGISPQKSVSSIDPNYQNINVLTKYLAHFRLAS